MSNSTATASTRGRTLTEALAILGAFVSNTHPSQLTRSLLAKPRVNLEEAGEVIHELFDIAAREYEHWLAGDVRFRSVTDLNIDRVAEIFNRIARGQQPTKERLYNDLGFPYGQATYVARVLADRQLAGWRMVARAELEDQPKANEDAARGHLANGEPSVPLRLMLSLLAWRELEARFETAARRNPELEPKLEPPKVASNVGDLHYVDRQSRTLVTVIDEATAPEPPASGSTTPKEREVA